MGGYLSLPGAWRDDADLAARWVEKAQAHVGSLPPKAQRQAREAPGRSVRGRSVQGRSVQGRSVQGRSVQGRSVRGRSVQGRSAQGGGYRVVQRGGGPADELAQVAAVDVQVAAGQAAVRVGEDRGGRSGIPALVSRCAYSAGQVVVADGLAGLGADLGGEFGQGERLVAAEFVDPAGLAVLPVRTAAAAAA